MEYHGTLCRPPNDGVISAPSREPSGPPWELPAAHLHDPRAPFTSKGAFMLPYSAKKCKCDQLQLRRTCLSVLGLPVSNDCPNARFSQQRGAPSRQVCSGATLGSTASQSQRATCSPAQREDAPGIRSAVSTSSSVISSLRQYTADQASMAWRCAASSRSSAPGVSRSLRLTDRSSR